MAANKSQDEGFDEYDKPGAERSRRRRGTDDDLDSDLEDDLLQEDWLSVKKNPSEVSDEDELNDDLLQSDDEDQNISGQDVSLDATMNMVTSYEQQDNVGEGDYADDIVNLGAEDGYEDAQEEGGYLQEGVGGEEEEQEQYTEEYSQAVDGEMHQDQMNYSGGLAQDDDAYQDEVLDIQITEPLDSEYQDNTYATSYADEPLDEQGVDREEERGGGEEEQHQEEEEDTGGSQILESEEVENEAEPEEEAKEESDEEEDEDEESGRLRFKSERKDGTVVRLADAAGKRRNIPETLELSEQAKADLMQFEEQERQRKQDRFGGRGRGFGRGRGGRGGFPGFGMLDFRGDRGGRGRMNNQRFPLMGNMGMQPRMPLPPRHHHPPHHQLQHHHHHQQQHHPQQQHHQPPGPRGPPPFQEHGGPLAQQPLQPLMHPPPHMAHRSPPPPRPQMEQQQQQQPPPRMMNSPPPNFGQHPPPPPPPQPPQPPQSKNIHINPHFRGPTPTSSSSQQVPLMPPAQSQPRPAEGPQRFPGPGDFQQHAPDNFGQPQRPPHHMEPFRGQQPPGPQEREPFFIGERSFPGQQHMFDHQGPAPLMNSGNNLHQQQLPGQGHMGFGQQGQSFNQPGQGLLGMFQREPPRPNLPPQGHQGMAGMNQHGGPPGQPRPFMGPRQPFNQQQGNPFPPPQLPFGMQGLLQGPPLPQHQHHEHQPMHQQQHHRQDLPHQHQPNPSEQRPMMHHNQNPFHQQQQHNSPRQMTPRPQNVQQRNAPIRPRMQNPPASKQQIQILSQRNSNLRELPVAPDNTNMNNARPTSAPNFRPVAKATQGVRPGQNAPTMPGGGRGRGQVAGKTTPQPGLAGRTVVRKEIPSAQPNLKPQDPDEDEETRQYRMKIEEQKRLRQEILRKKEMRRQMQAGLRKKELLERLNAQAGPQSQGPTSSQNQPLHQQQQQQQQYQQQQQQQQQQQLHQQQHNRQPPPQALQQHQQQHQQPPQHQPQTQFPPRPQQSQIYAGTTFAPNGTPQAASPGRPNVKTRLQMGRGGLQPQQSPRPGPNQAFVQQQQQQLQQRRSIAPQNLNRPGSQIQQPQAGQRIMPIQGVPGAAQGQALGLKPGVKRTVMQRAKGAAVDGPQIPQKVRVVKLSGADGGGPVQQQQGVRAIPQLPPGPQRKVTLPLQQHQGPAMTAQAGRGTTGGNPPHNRVVVPSRGRGRGGVGPGAGQMGRGRPMATRQTQRAPESQPCTVSIEGLSSSTTDTQLKNLLNSIGPLQMFKMLPQQRKAVARFSNAQHASSFQMSFHRHMIDLSHIDVSLIDG